MPARLIATCFLMTGLLLGCQAPQPRNPEPAATAEPVPVDNVELVSYIGRQPFITAEPAYRAAYLLRYGDAFTGDYDQLRTLLADEGLVGRSWQHPPTQRLNRGEIGYLLCRTAQIEQSLNWILFRLGRYAYRDLQLLGIAGPGGEFSLVSGGEFQGILRRTENYMQENRIELAPDPVLGAAP
jgi:hypothetical protein